MKEINEAKKNPRITRYPFASGFHPTLSSCLRQNVSQTNDRTEKFDFLPFPLFPLLPRIKTFPFRWELSPRSSPSKNRVSPSSLHRGASSTVVGDSSRSRTGFCACKYAVVRASWLSDSTRRGHKGRRELSVSIRGRTKAKRSQNPAPF